MGDLSMEITDLYNLASLPPRIGPTPRMTPTNPQEQLDQWPQRWEIIDALADFAFALPGVVERPTIIAPDGSRALTLPYCNTPNPAAFMGQREFAHIHNAPTGSMHAMLPKSVRNLASDKGWILRHPFAVRGVGPEATVFIFAPRDDDELLWAKALLAVSYAWAIGAAPG